MLRRLFWIGYFSMAVAWMEGSYNSFVDQTGFCKLQGFDTVSRSTSHSVPMFMDGRVSFGVGTRFRSISDCGRCLRIRRIDRFAIFSFELDSYEYDGARNDSGIDAIIFDQCLDPVCTPGYLDFDIYSPLQPVRDGNPTHLEWEFVPCPILPGEFIELLFCFSNTCHEHDAVARTSATILAGADPFYWTVFVRNSRLPVRHLYLPEHNVALDDDNGWVYRRGAFHLTIPFSLTIDHRHNVTIDLLRHPSLDDYRGGILVPTTIQT